MTKINIVFDVVGSTNSKNITFKPSMVNKLIKSNDIYFPENFMLYKSNILTALSKQSSDITHILTDINKFTALVKYNNKQRVFKKVREKDIIGHNVEFMRKLWFSNNSKIMITDKFNYINEYIIVSSESGPLQKKPTTTPDSLYEMRVKIMVSKDASRAAKLRLTCQKNRDDINVSFKKVFDVSYNIFDAREIDNSNTYKKPSRLFANNATRSSTSRNDIMSLHQQQLLYDRRRREREDWEYQQEKARRRQKDREYRLRLAQLSSNDQGTTGGTIRRSRQTQRRRRRRAQIKYTRERLV